MGTLVATILTSGAVLAAAPANAAATTGATIVVDQDGMASATDCNGVGMAFPTIGAGVMAVTPGDTVKVCPGTYDETVTVDKALTINGAQAGVDARNRNTSTESRVQPTGTTDSATFNITASNVTLDGFLLTGNENGPAVQTAATESGYHILNNRIVANAFGVYFNASGDNPSVVKQNAITTNNENLNLGVASAAGNGICSDQGLAGGLIQSNKFRNNINAGVLIAGDAQGLTASGNNSSADGAFFAAFPSSGYRVINNTVALSNGSGIYFTGASGVTVQKNRVYNSGFSDRLSASPTT